MEKRVLTEADVKAFLSQMEREEKSVNTLCKYARDLKKLQAYVRKREITKELMIGYKEELCKRYQSSSVNSFLVVANRFLEMKGWHDCRVRQIRVQRKAFCDTSRDLSREEYQKLVKSAFREGKKRIAYVMETICSTGIRVSELSYITVKAVRQGCAQVQCKGKVRTVLFPKKLQKNLLRYIAEQKITSGMVFRTNTGKALDRVQIWREMKQLCAAAGVAQSKVYPHNLRHLFAKCFYEIKRDIVRLADVLGHSSIETTRIYTISTGKEHQRQLDALGLVVGETT